MSYVEDTFPVYRLDQADLEKYLRELHGSRDFHIEVINDTYKFRIPKKLDANQRRTLAGRRWEDD